VSSLTCGQLRNYQNNQEGQRNMTIRRIISSGQSGAAKAALDAAIRLHVSHGGWIPRARSEGHGYPDPERYGLSIMESTGYTNYAQCIERNVLDADGSLILSRGALEGLAAMTRRLAGKHGKPYYHLDLDEKAGIASVRGIHKWACEQAVFVLNVAGPVVDREGEVYEETFRIVEGVLQLARLMAAKKKHSSAQGPTSETEAIPEAPQTVGDAVRLLLRDLPLKDRTTIANMTAAELPGLDATIGKHIRNRFDLVDPATPLLKACAFLAGKPALTESEASALILEELTYELHQTHRLRVV